MLTFIDFFGFNIPSYGLCMGIAMLLCGFLIIRKSSIVFEDMIIISAVTVGAALFGGGLLYIAVTYSPRQIFEFVKELDFSFITNGGLVFYGGLVGGISGAVICAKILKVKIEALEMCAVPYVPLGHAIGRIGCALAGCCHGFEYNGPFAISGALGKTYFPIQLIEAALDLVIMLVLLRYARQKRPKYSILFSYLLMYSLMRFFTEFFRGDEVRGAFLIFSTSQWISILIIALCIVRMIKKDNL